MRKKSAADRLQEFSQICHKHHLKITPQRVAIYQELLNSDAHPTADAVYQIVKGEYPNISYDTVNRTLLTFAEIGIVDVVETFGGAKRFDPNVTDHHHLHCTRCGKIFDFVHRAYDHLEVPPEVRDQFKVTSKRVVLKGICKACRQ
jgi:Fur family peroxide stress response transcriptional regulator